MTVNLMNQYIGLTEKQIYSILKLIFGSKMNKKYSDIFIEKYINIRFYNFYEYDTNITMRRKILDNIKKIQEDIMINHIEDRVLIEQMGYFFHYVLYIDNVLNCNDYYALANKITKDREKQLDKKSVDFCDKVYQMIIDYKAKKEDLINKFDTDDFYLKISNYQNKNSVYRVNLDHNIKFPEEFSQFAIEKAFNIGLTNEDKLTIEYYLVVQQVLKDIIAQNFKKQYIVEFTDTILSKNKKLKSLLNIIDNAGTKDKVCLKIKYEHFQKNQEKLYELMQDGFRIAIILDSTFEVNYKNVEMLNIFSYIIINKQLENYEKIQEYKNSLKNVIEV